MVLPDQQQKRRLRYHGFTTRLYRLTGRFYQSLRDAAMSTDRKINKNIFRVAKPLFDRRRVIYEKQCVPAAMPLASHSPVVSGSHFKVRFTVEEN